MRKTITPSILTPSVGYKPHRYPWAFDKWQTQQRIHWLPEEVPLAEDVKDWAINLTNNEKALLTQIFRFFTQSDIEVQDNYMTRLGGMTWPTEVKMMLAAFANMESVHVAAYSNLIETVGMPETTYSQFLDYKELKDKYETYQKFSVQSAEEIAKTLAMFGGFAEGVQLFASFAILMNFPRRNRMKGMGQIVSWSVRDESLHCDGMTELFKTYCQETGVLTRGLKSEIYGIAETVVEQEDRFVELAFDSGPVEGLSVDEMKHYIRYMTDYRLRNLGLKSIFKSGRKHPLPWLPPLLSGHEHANFFETRATEYSKGATRGSWSDVWAELEKTGYTFIIEDDPKVTAAFASDSEQNSWGVTNVGC